MKKMKGIIAFLLSLVAFFQLCGTSAFAGDDYQNTTAQDNFVLLLDCSMSLGHTDRDSLCLEACKNFLDTLPTENARVSVVTFGYLDSDAYDYSDLFSSMVGEDDRRHVHTVVPHEVLDDSQAKARYKDLIQSKHTAGRMNEQTMTPIGHAIAAGVDILAQNGAADGKGCMILVSDGLADALDNKKDSRLIESASKTAGEHKWKIYGIELNYDHSKHSEIKAADDMFDLICSNSGATDVGRLSCNDAISVHISFQQIINDYFNLSSNPTERIKLPGTKEFSIPELTSESTVNIFGTSISSVELTHLNTGKTQTFDKSMDSDNISVSVEPGSYFSIKMLCPEAGDWKITIYGKKDAEALISNCTLQEMGIQQTTKASSTGTSLSKNDKITVNSSFAYRGQVQTGNPFYEKNPATLLVTLSDGSTKEYTMSANSNGYYYELPLTGFISGNLELKTIVKNGMFRDGQKESNRSVFKLENMELYLSSNPEEISRSAYANSAFAPIDLNRIYTNPDNDLIICDLICRDNRDEKFEHSQNGNELIVQAGNRDGEYNLLLCAKDPEMGHTVDYPILLSVENRAPELIKKIGDAKILMNCFYFQKAEKKEFNIDLDQYFADPDGSELTYTVSEPSGIVNINQDGSFVNLMPLAEGESSLTITASDGVKELSEQIELSVLNGKSQYIKQYGFLYLIALAVLLFILAAIFIILRNKRVKGTWDIEFKDDDGMVYTAQGVDISAYTQVGRRSKFKLSELLPELIPFIQNAGSFNPAIFSTATQCVTLIGVYRRKGLKVRIKQKNNAGLSVSADCNGRHIERGTASMGTGYLEINVVDSASGSGMSISMHCY